MYTIPEWQALQIAHAALAATLPGESITELQGTVRGYSALFRFMLDTYSQQIIVYPVVGTTATGQKIPSYYFEVSGSGSSIVQGRGKNIELFDRVTTLAQATGKAETMVSVEARQAETAQGERPGSPGAPEKVGDAFDLGFARCQAYTNRTKEQCFDACNK